MVGGSGEPMFGLNPNAINKVRSEIAIAGAMIRKKIEICKFFWEKCSQKRELIEKAVHKLQKNARGLTRAN